MAVTYEPVWDVTIGGTGFLLANSDERPYLRETTPARRERFDSAREPGENSLDSALWIRSQTSWHLGCGDRYAEPLEQEANIARFKYHYGYNANPSEAGSMKVYVTPQILASSAGCKKIIPSTVNGQFLGFWDSGTYQGVRRMGFNASGTVNHSRMCSLATFDPGTIVCPPSGSTYWWGYISGTGIVRGNGSVDTYSTAVSTSSAVPVHYSHGRLWLGGMGGGYYEVTDPETFTTLPAKMPTPGYSGVLGSHLMTSNQTCVYFGGTSDVRRLTVNSDGTLSAMKVVAVLPTGEWLSAIKAYGEWLFMITSQGVRICDASDPDRVILGPALPTGNNGLNIDMDAAGSFLYVLGGMYDGVPDSTVAPDRGGCTVIDLSRQMTSVNGSLAGSYPWWYGYYPSSWSGSSQYGRGICAGDGGRTMIFADANGNIHRTYQYLTTKGTAQFGTGQIDFSTSEKKAWLGLSVDIGGTSGTFRIYATTSTGSESEVTSGAVSTPVNTTYEINESSLPPGGWIKYRVVLTGNAEVYSIGVQATPMPKRTRYIKLPLECFDAQLDRNNTPVGYEGFGYERLTALEALEESGALTTVVDNRTGETKRCVIDRVTYEGETPPDRSKPNFGGVVSVTLLSV